MKPPPDDDDEDYGIAALNVETRRYFAELMGELCEEMKPPGFWDDVPTRRLH
jgi:hypothetical protein